MHKITNRETLTQLVLPKHSGLLYVLYSSPRQIAFKVACLVLPHWDVVRKFTETSSRLKNTSHLFPPFEPQDLNPNHSQKPHNTFSLGESKAKTTEQREFALNNRSVFRGCPKVSSLKSRQTPSTKALFETTPRLQIRLRLAWPRRCFENCACFAYLLLGLQTKRRSRKPNLKQKPWIRKGPSYLHAMTCILT